MSAEIETRKSAAAPWPQLRPTRHTRAHEARSFPSDRPIRQPPSGQPIPVRACRPLAPSSAASTMAHGAPAMSQAERHRLYLQNLQRRKQLEKEAEAMRNAHRDSAVALENGFQGFFNGANREVGKSLPSKHRAAPVRVESREKLLRVPGAVPVPSPFAHREAWADEGVQPPPRTARRRHEAQSEAPSERRSDAVETPGPCASRLSRWP